MVVGDVTGSSSGMCASRAVTRAAPFRPACWCILFSTLSVCELPLGPCWVLGFGRAGPRSASPSAVSYGVGAWGT